MLSVVSSFAYEVGDFIYTRNGRFKVTSANLIQNGDFKNGLADWKTAGGFDLNTEGCDTFTVENVGGPAEGMNYIKVGADYGRGSSTTATNTWGGILGAANLFLNVQRTANTRYVFTYKVRSGDDATEILTSNTYNVGRNANFMVFYASEDGLPTSVAGSADAINDCWERYGNEWTEVAYDYTSETEGFLSVLFANMASGSCYADFGIYEVNAVADKRLVSDALDQLKFYQSHPDDFPMMQEELAGIIAELENVADDLSADELKATLEGYIGGGEESFLTAFFNANTADAGSKFNNFFFNEGSANKNTLPGWTSSIGGNRFASHTAHANFFTQHVDQEIQASYNLDAGYYYQSAELAAGKYLYMVQAQAKTYGQDGRGKNSNYRINRYGDQVKGLYAYIVNTDANGVADTTKIEMDDVPTYRGKTYMAVVNLGEGTKTVGFYFPGTTGTVGGMFCVDNLQLRIIGAEQAEIDYKANLAAYAIAKENLQKAIEAAQEVANNTAYVYGKEDLNAAITEAQALLEASTDDNIVLGDNEGSLQAIQNVKDGQNVLDVARRAMVKLNAEYVQLGSDIEKCREDIKDETRPAGKDAFQAAIDKAAAYYGAQTADSRDSLTLVQTDTELMLARQDYYILNASYATPADLYLVNNTFQKKNTEGWEQDGKDSNDAWKFGANDAFSEGYAIYYNRGNSAADEKWVYQDVEIKQPGVYEFEAELAVHNSKNTADNLTTQTYIYVGTDSLEVCTKGDGSGNQSMGEVRKFKVRAIVDDLNSLETPGVLRVGLYKAAYNVNIVYMGSCHLLYSGAYDKYLADSNAVVLAPTKEELQLAVNEAKALRDEARNPNNVDTTPFTNAINAAQAVIDNKTATLEEVNAQFPALATAKENFVFSGVWPAKGKFYDHSKLLKNAKFNDAEDRFNFWACDSLDEAGNKVADAFNYFDGSEGYIWSFHRSGAGMKRSANIHQEISGLAKGFYTFAANAVYRYAWKEEWVAGDYENENVWFKMVSSSDTVALKGFMHEGAQLVDAENTKSNLIYPNGATISIYSVRHHGDSNGVPAIVALFESGLFQTECPVRPDAEGKATVGFLVETCPDNSAVMANNLTLRFYGDAENFGDGIETVENSSVSVKSSAVYNISGQKVNGSLQKGLYIQNGKKFVVK